MKYSKYSIQPVIKVYDTDGNSDYQDVDTLDKGEEFILCGHYTTEEGVEIQEGILSYDNINSIEYMYERITGEKYVK